MKKYVITLIFGLLLLNSCAERLNIEQWGVLSEDTFYQTDEQATEAITAVYSTWRGQYFNWFYLKNMLSDDTYCGGGGRGDNSNFEMINEYRFSTASTVVSGAFSGFYSIIYMSNLIVDRVKPDTDIKARVVGEAKAARAWAMTELISLWGAVPFADHVLGADEYQLPNGDIPTMWAWVEQNLTEAAAVLPSKSGINGQQAIGARLTKEAALAFLGKAQIFQEKYAEAATSLKSVINSNKYDLVADFSQLLRSANDFGPENIFESNAINDPDNAWSQGTMLFSLMINWRSDHLTGMPEGIWNTGWGFFNPTKSLYEAFVAMEGPEGYRLTNTMKTREQMGGGWAFDWETFQMVYVPIQITTPLYGNEGFMQWKHRFPSDEVVTNSWGYSSYNNFRWMRYAEVLLLAAEACLLSGDQASALNYINQVRARAHLESLGSLTLEDIKKEKRLELCFECTRYQDLVRWGDASSVLAQQGKIIPALHNDGKVTVAVTNTDFGFKSGKHELLPFPEHEMNVNKNLVQNPGW